jgi:lipopolysaccharide export system permease protein
MNITFLYLVKKFLIKFSQIFSAFFLLGFVINLTESTRKYQDLSLNFLDFLFLSILKTPKFIDDISLPIILLATMALFINLSARSEITALRNIGLSFFGILKPIIITSIIIGLIWITLFYSLVVKSNNLLNATELRIINRKVIDSDIKDGNFKDKAIWLKQSNQEFESGEIIIRINKIANNLVDNDIINSSDIYNFSQLSLWFFDNNAAFYKKIDAKFARFDNNSWHLSNIVINDSNLINKQFDKITINSNLTIDFIDKTIKNNLQEVGFFNLFTLPKIINQIEDSGFSSLKFKAKYHHLLTRPLLFVAMAIMAMFFAANHYRSPKNAIKIFCGILSGLCFYIIDILFLSLSSFKIVSIFAGTWIIAIICFTIAILLTFYKEKIIN